MNKTGLVVELGSLLAVMVRPLHRFGSCSSSSEYGRPPHSVLHQADHSTHALVGRVDSLQHLGPELGWDNHPILITDDSIDYMEVMLVFEIGLEVWF